MREFDIDLLQNLPVASPRPVMHRLSPAFFRPNGDAGRASQPRIIIDANSIPIWGLSGGIIPMGFPTNDTYFPRKRIGLPPVLNFEEHEER
jgi:hypothetical protein